MPQNPVFMSQDKLLQRSEISQMANLLFQLGIDELRITGGEPSLRPDFLEIMKDLSSIPFKRLGLTTNGIKFKRFLPELKKTSLRNINFSLDSLNKAGFLQMTGKDSLQDVLEALFSAQEYGFEVKINMVMMRGVNARELFDFIDFSAQHNIEVRFLELMRIGVAREFFDEQFISAGEMISSMEKKYKLKTVPQEIDSTSFNFQLDNSAQIGFIASESRPFCGDCSRLRISADGVIRPCLMVNEGVSVKNKSREEMLAILGHVMAKKPTERIYEVSQSMNQIGG
jgi:GTP 3',8-cyclase